MPTIEWIGSMQNLPHQFTSTANETLQMAKQRQMFNGQDLGPMWTVLWPGGRNELPGAPIQRNATTGVYEYLPVAYWTIDNVTLTPPGSTGGKTLNEIFNNAPPPDPGPGVADVWVGGPHDTQVYVPPVVVVPNPGGTMPTTEPAWQGLITEIDDAAAHNQLTSAMLASALAALEQIPPPRGPIVESKISDWGFILANNLLGDRGPAGTFAPVRVVVEGRGRMVYSQEELNQALAAGGYIEALDGTGNGTGAPLPAASSPSLLTWGLIAAGALYALRRK